MVPADESNGNGDNGVDRADDVEETVGAGATETEESADPDDEESRLRALIDAMADELQERDRKLRDYIAAHQHAVQEMDAARKRMERDREEEVDRDRSALAGTMLEVVDDLDRSLQAGETSGNVAAVLEGVALVRNRVMGKLKELGVEPLNSLGERFDPNVHEAVGMIPVADAEQDQQVIAEEQTGFLFKGKLLRAARVIVGTHTGS